MFGTALAISPIGASSFLGILVSPRNLLMSSVISFPYIISSRRSEGIFSTFTNKLVIEYERGNLAIVKNEAINNIIELSGGFNSVILLNNTQFG